MRVIRARLSGAMLFVAACGGGAGKGADPAGLATVLDSTADSVVARVTGAVPVAAVRHLVQELSIAPAIDDTSLFTEVSEFDVDPGGRFWVYDRPSNTIFLFGADGKLVRRIGRQGAGPGEFNSDNGMVALGDSGLAIWDARNGRISLLDSAGAFRSSWTVATGFFTSNGLLGDRAGHLYLRRAVTAPREGEILGRMGLVRLKPDGSFGDSLVPPDMPVPRDQYLAVHVEKGGGRGQSSMSSTYAPGYYWAWHPAGFFVAADGGKYEVVLTPPGRKPLVIRRSAPAVPITEAERDEERANVIHSMRGTDPGWTWQGPPIPSAKAPVRAVSTTRDGRIWLRVAAPSERIPDAELPVRRDSTAPVMHFRTPVVYEVFSAEGRFLGRVEFPPRATLIEADADRVWVLGRDENDLPAVMRLRIEPALH